MSKIFEALCKTESRTAEVARALLATEPQAVAGTESTEAGHRDEAAASERDSAQNGSSSEVRTENIEIPRDSPVLPFDRSNGSAEQYKIIRTKIQQLPSQPRIVLVSSAMPGDGKTVTSINLAAAFSVQENARVLLLDCDFRRGSATRMLGITTPVGLGEVVRNQEPLESALVRITRFPNLYVLAPGNTSPGPAELLSTSKWLDVVETLRSEFRFVVIDAPPIGAVAEYELLQAASDGVVLVVRQDHTNRQLWIKALDMVPKTKQLGVVINCAEPWFLWKTHGYYYGTYDA